MRALSLVRASVPSPLASVDSVGVGRCGVGGGVLMAVPLFLPSFRLWEGGSPPFCCLRGFPTSISGAARPPRRRKRKGGQESIRAVCAGVIDS